MHVFPQVSCAAIETDEGLVVPVLCDANDLSAAKPTQALYLVEFH